MTTFQQKPNTGVLFQDKKRKTEKHPTHKDTVNINGVEMWINGWINTPKNSGDKYLSLSFSPKQKPQNEPQPTKQAPPAQGDFI